MKLWKRISLIFCFTVVFLGFGFYVGYSFSQFFYPGREEAQLGRELSIQTKVEPVETDAAGAETASGEAGALPAAEKEKTAAGQQIMPAAEQASETSFQTLYLVEAYDLSTGERIVEEEGRLPERFIGLDREQFVEAMQEYEKAPSLADQKKGFESLEVESFSPVRVTVRKNYRSVPLGRSFYLIVQNHYIFIYEEDRKTLFMPTDILLEALPEVLQREIIAGKRIESEEELYNFLESYSS